MTPSRGAVGTRNRRPRHDPHPLLALVGTVARIPRYLVLARALIREPAVPRRRKVALGAAIGYAVSPIDLVPGVIPVVGQLDDIAALLIGLRQALHACPPDRLEAHLASAGLSRTALDTDLHHVRVATGWLVLTGIGLARTGAGAALATASSAIGRCSKAAARGYATWKARRRSRRPESRPAGRSRVSKASRVDPRTRIVRGQNRGSRGPR